MDAPFRADFTALPARDRYKLLCALVVPRPIALVTTLGPGGIVNAAPFSFFNVFAETPPLVVLGLQSRPDGSLKDTSAHIRNIGSFTVNLVDEALAERMNVCAVDFPPGTSELDAAGLTALPAVSIPVPRIAEAAASLECRHYRTLEVSPERRLCVGEVVYLHARAGIVDAPRMYVNLDVYKPVARLFANLYAPLGEPFTLCRVARLGRHQRRSSCTAPSAMVTAAWVGSITGMPSACSSGRRWRAMPAQPITSASAPSFSFNCRPTSTMRSSVLSPLAVSATDISSGRSPTRRSVSPICSR